MPEDPAEPKRVRRALAMIAASLTALIVVGLFYLEPSAPSARAGPSPPPPTPAVFGPPQESDRVFYGLSLGWVPTDGELPGHAPSSAGTQWRYTPSPRVS